MRVLKDPAARLDYVLDWSEWLDGDTLDTVTWTVPTGLVLVSQSETDNVATVWLSGGDVGETYPIVCQVNTDGGRLDERTISVSVVQR